jgi:hypothetical protein
VRCLLVPCVSARIRSVYTHYLLESQYTCVHFVPSTKVDGSWDSAVDIVTMLRARRSRVQILSGTRDLSILEKVQIGSGVDPTSYSVGTGVLFRG